MAKIIINAGFTVNSDKYPSIKQNALTWERAKKYNVIVVSGFGESNGDRSLTPVNKKTVKVLRKFVENGGGIFVVGQYGQRQTEISPQEMFLKPLGLQPLWKEMPVDTQSVKGSPWQVDFAYTQNISSSPITKGVKALWYPAPNRRIGDQHHSIVFKADSSWKIPIKGSGTSSTSYDVKGSHTSLSGTGLKPTFTQNIPLLAYRNVGKGRVVYFAPCYQYLQSNLAFEDMKGIMLKKGLRNKPSDGLKIFINSLKWLAVPSEKIVDLGGAKTDKSLLRDPNQIIYGKAFNWGIAREFKKRPYDMPGLIGAISNYSAGKGTPAEWVTAAKQAGYRFIVFLEDFKYLDKKKFDQLKTECKKLTDDKFAAFAGFTIDDEIGNHYYYFGNSFSFPAKELYDSKRKVFVSYDPALGGHIKGQLSMTVLSFFIGKNIARLTGGNYLFSKDAAPFSDWFSNYNSIGVVTSFDGKMAEFAFKDYLDMVASGQGPNPLALTFVDSPEKIKNIKWRTIYKSNTNSSDEMIKYFNRQHFYPDNPSTIYISAGPQIDNWTYIGPRDYAGNNKGNFVWQNYRWKLKGAMSSNVGLKEVIVWDGTKKFRVFRPHGAKKFEFVLDLNHDKQHYLLIEAIDINGKKAISREQFDRNHRLEAFSCGDRNNQLTYSLSINKKGSKVYAGNNGTLGAPYKRLGDRGFGISPTLVFRSAKGFDGGVFRGPRNVAVPKFKLKGAGNARIPVVMQAFRGLNSMDVSVGVGKRQYNFTDNIREANVWHTNWKTKRDEYLDVDYHSRYFQLDPDKPIAVIIRKVKITLRKDMPNYGIDFSNFLRPADSKYFAIRSSTDGFYGGGWNNSCDNRKKITMKLDPGSYISCFGSSVGGMAIFPLSKDLVGTSTIALKSSFISLKIPESRSPQKAGESITFKMLFMGYPVNKGIMQDNNLFIEQFRKQFGLDGGKGAYKLDIKSGTIISQEYVLKTDGAKNKCFAAKITGKLVARLPIAVENCNDKWSAFYYDSKIKGGRPVGVEDNIIWTTIIVNNQDVFVGHPVTADNDRLHIQVTQTDLNSWGIEIHNPTEKEITAEIILNKFFPPFKDKKAIGKITIKAGSSIYKIIK